LLAVALAVLQTLLLALQIQAVVVVELLMELLALVVQA
jgi:hypothetical protein